MRVCTWAWGSCCRSLQTLIDLARENGVTLPAYTVEELRSTLFHDAFGSLEKYLECFRYTTAVLQAQHAPAPTCGLTHAQTPSALERVAYELACDNFDENVIYFEVRFAPQLHASPSMNIYAVLEAVNQACRAVAMQALSAAGSCARAGRVQRARAGEGRRAPAIRVRHHRVRHAQLRRVVVGVLQGVHPRAPVRDAAAPALAGLDGSDHGAAVTEMALSN